MQRLTSTSIRSRLARHVTSGMDHFAGGPCHPAARRRASGLAESVADSAKSANSRVLHRGGAVALCGVMGWAAACAVEDVYIYDECSSKALQKASQDPRLKEAIGDGIKLGRWHWYQASLAVAHEGTSASCSFPVYGSEGVANLRLKAVRLQGKKESVFHNIFGGGRWEVLMLQAQVPRDSGGKSSPYMQTIDLMQTTDEPKAGDGARGKDSGPCRSASLQEV